MHPFQPSRGPLHFLLVPVRPGRGQGQPPGLLASQGITNLLSQLATMGMASAEGHPREGLALRRWHHEGITGGPSAPWEPDGQKDQGSAQGSARGRGQTQQQLKQFPHLDLHRFAPIFQCPTVPPYQQFLYQLDSPSVG